MDIANQAVFSVKLGQIQEGLIDIMRAHVLKLNIFLFLFVLIASMLLVVAPKANAQQTESITLNVTPTVIELDGNPGDTLEGSFKIVNGSEISLLLNAIAKNFTASDEVGGVNITEDDTSYSLAKWVTIDPVSAEVDARGSQIFNYTIDIPEDAEPGGHFGSLIVKTEAVRVDLTGPSVAQEVGPLVLVRIAGDTFQEASIVEFNTIDSFVEKGPVTFETRVKNTGNVHFKPKGKIEIKNMFGSVVTTIDLDEQNVLPDSIRKLTNDWNPTGLTVGRYTADLTVVYGVDDTIVTSSTTFVVFPYKTIIPITVFVLLTVFIAINKRERIKKAINVLKNG